MSTGISLLGHTTGKKYEEEVHKKEALYGIEGVHTTELSKEGLCFQVAFDAGYGKLHQEVIDAFVDSVENQYDIKLQGEKSNNYWSLEAHSNGHTFLFEMVKTPVRDIISLQIMNKKLANIDS